MKKILLLLAVLVLTKFVNGQTYGGEIQGKNNSLAVAPIKRNGDALKTSDSALLARLISVISSGKFQVDVITAPTTTVSGTVTANAGTNLNTSLLALESGGNLATIAGKDFATQTTLSSVLTKLTAGSASMIHLEDVASADADGGNGLLAVRKATPANTSGSDGDYEFLQMANGRLWTSATIDAALPAGTNAIGKLAANSGVTIGAVEIAASQTLSTVTTVSTVTNLSQLGGQAIAMNTGTRSAGTQRVTIATDDVVPASQSGTWTVQPGNTANTTAWLTTQTPATSGGLTTYHLVSAASTNATNVKASAGQLYGYYIFNANASARKIAFHNTSGTPTAGSSVLFSLVIPAGSGANVEFDNGIAFSSGIGITTVTGTADSDATAVAAGDLIINLFYK